MLLQESKKIYRDCLYKSDIERIYYTRVAYKQAEEAFKKVLGSWGGFNATIDATLMCLCCDGDFTRRDHQIFLDISGKSPTYDELYNNAVAVSKNYNNIINSCKNAGNDVIACLVTLFSAVFACKGNYGSNEESIICNLIY